MFQRPSTFPLLAAVATLSGAAYYAAQSLTTESFKHITTVSPKGSFKDDMAELPGTLPTPKTPASFAYRLDSKEMGKYEWMMITFVPDDAGVSFSRDKPMGFSADADGRSGPRCCKRALERA